MSSPNVSGLLHLSSGRKAGNQSPFTCGLPRVQLTSTPADALAFAKKASNAEVAPHALTFQCAVDCQTARCQIALTGAALLDAKRVIRLLPIHISPVNGSCHKLFRIIDWRNRPLVHGGPFLFVSAYQIDRTLFSRSGRPAQTASDRVVPAEP